MNIRGYSAEDFEGAMNVFLSNLASHFVAEDQDDFSQFLRHTPEHFFVGEVESRLVACGGFWLPNSSEARLTWGMVHHDYHKQGIGSEMLKYRLNKIKQHGVKQIVCSTSQLTDGFFAKHGFKLSSKTANGFGPDIDEVVLTLSL